MKVSPLFKPRRYVKVSDEALEACVGVYQHPANPGISFTVTRQQNYLMMERTGWGQAKVRALSPAAKPWLSPTYCNCSAGYVTEGIERATGKIVKSVEILESVKRGGKDCRKSRILYTRGQR